MTLSPQLVLDRARARWSRRAPHEGTWRAIAQAMRPLRDSFLTSINPQGLATARPADRYDTTASRASAGLAAALYNELTNPANDWIGVELADGPPRDLEGRRWLEQTNSVMLRSFDLTTSGFYNEMYAFMLDMPTLGTACLYAGRPGLARRIQDTALPLSECAFDIGADGRASHFDRWFWEPVWSLAQSYGLEALPLVMREQIARDPGEHRQVLHATYPNPDYDPEAVWGRKAKLYVSHVIDVETSQTIQIGHFARNPYYAGRWDVFPGSPYGRGLGELAMPSHGALDEMKRSAIIAAQLAAEPPMATVDEELAALRPTPGARLPGALTERGELLMQALPMVGNWAQGRELMLDERKAVEDTFLLSLVTFASSPTPSVEEVLVRQEDRRTLTLPNMVRFMRDVLLPVGEDRFQTLVRGGQIPPAPRSIAGAPLKLNFKSPILAAARASKAKATMQLFNTTAQFAQLDPTVRHRFDAHAALEQVRLGLDAPLSVLRDDQTVAQILAQEQQQQEAMQALEQARLTAPAVESLARAEQTALG